MSRLLTDLRPEMRRLVDPFLDDAAAEGIDVLVTCTLRTLDEQATIYAQGRTTPGVIVTDAKPGQSAHNHRLGMDIVPIVNGKPDWTGTSPVWIELANLARARGLQWLGEPNSEFHEACHFQVPNWRSLIDTGE